MRFILLCVLLTLLASFACAQNSTGQEIYEEPLDQILQRVARWKPRNESV